MIPFTYCALSIALFLHTTFYATDARPQSRRPSQTFHLDSRRPSRQLQLTGKTIAASKKQTIEHKKAPQKSEISCLDALDRELEKLKK